MISVIISRTFLIVNTTILISYLCFGISIYVILINFLLQLHFAVFLHENAHLHDRAFLSIK